MAPSETLSDETGSQKFKMAAEKTELNVAQLLYTIATKLLDVRIRKKSKMAAINRK